jgi:1-acyl-sn-glycerol-3-phosphate acyltransferase
VRGREDIPACGPALLANKHSESDGIFLAANIPGVAFVAMQELFRYPLIGALLYRLQMIRVDACGGQGT